MLAAQKPQQINLGCFLFGSVPYDLAMTELRTHQHFIDSADLMYQSAPLLGRTLDEAVQSLLACLTSGGKVLVWGEGISAALAGYLAARMVSRFERDRPGLPALQIGGNMVSGAALAETEDPALACARPLQALGQPGDVLVLLSASPVGAVGLAALAAAHERDVSVIAITGAGSSEMAWQLIETDVHVAIPSDRAARVLEVQLLVVNCLLDGIDAQLLGDEEEIQS